MYGFIIIIFVIFAFMGGTVGYLHHDEEKSKIKILFHICVGAIVAMALIGMLVGGIYLNIKQDIHNYNRGICQHCGGEYHLVGAEKSRMGVHTFYYECENCHNTIETSSRMK